MFIKAQGKRSRVNCKMFHSYPLKKLQEKMSTLLLEKSKSKLQWGITSHQNSHCQILYKEPKLERVWRNEKHPSSMLECQLGTPTMETVCMYAKSLQSCLTLYDPMDCNLPDSSIHGILQSRILEWIPMPSSRGASPLGDRTRISYVSCLGRQVLYH